MSNLFELSVDELRSLVDELKPDLKGRHLDEETLRAKVTEWLLMNGLFTLHKFSRNASGRWELPTKLDDCRSCKQLKMRNKLLPRWLIFEQPSASGSFVDPLTASAVPTQRESSRPSFAARLASLSSFSFPPTARSQQRQESNSQDKDYYENVPECMSACCRCCTAPCREVGEILSTLFNWLTCNRQANDEENQIPPPINRY